MSEPPSPRSKLVLDPTERVSEALFGLIMVLIGAAIVAVTIALEG